ncbi:unnamed protein product [Ectocarpus fasciculatus]
MPRSSRCSRYEDRANILRGSEDTIFRLVCDRATPEQWAEWLRAPLEHAAATADHDLVKKLLNAGANGSTGWVGCDGKTLLHAAAEGGNAQVIMALLRAGAAGDKDTAASYKERTPLHVAASCGKEAAAKALMMAGADVHSLDTDQDTPLHLAIEGDFVELAEDLLLSGADPNAKGSRGSYPIQLAAGRGQDEVVSALVQKGANLNCLDAVGKTPLYLAVVEDRVSTVRVLLAAGADASFRLANATTVLHVAAECNEAGAIGILVEAGADVEARSKSGQTPLWFSAFYGSYTAMLTLLQLGAGVNSVGTYGSTPLHAACKRGHADVAHLLLRWGADETIVDNRGRIARKRLPAIANVVEEYRPGIERLSKVLARAPQDRAWCRRGFLVMCRARPDKVRLKTAEILDPTAAGNHPQERDEGLIGLAARLMKLADEDVFRKVVGLL